jgi:hypothetical protein
MALMEGVAIILALLLAGLVGYKIWASVEPYEYTNEPPPTEEELLQARLEILKVEKVVDVALAKQDHRREFDRIRQALDDDLKRNLS